MIPGRLLLVTALRIHQLLIGLTPSSTHAAEFFTKYHHGLKNNVDSSLSEVQALIRDCIAALLWCLAAYNNANRVSDNESQYLDISYSHDFTSEQVQAISVQVLSKYWWRKAGDSSL